MYGAADIARVAAQVRKLGDGRTIPNRMSKRIRKAVPPIRRSIRKSAKDLLPARGGARRGYQGLNRWVAAAKVQAKILRGPRTASVSLVIGRKSEKNRSDLHKINDKGVVRAPTFDRRGPGDWHTQHVPDHYVEKGIENQGGLDAFRHEVNEAIGEAVREVFGG